ncbi:MAG: ClpXP protease specificity-enhancing factor SspB [Gammaproteobacteria bacterium]|nr:ClpXP protease specificity-enhancing factor SspB [Gammaproteobacteria bacterium]
MSTTGQNTVASTKPYLVRAIRDWAIDNGMVPQVLVDTQHPHVRVPAGHEEEERIVLNVGAHAVEHFTMDNDGMAFAARFGGRPFEVFVPMDAVLAIYDRESGQGLMFEAHPEGAPGNDSPPAGDDQPRKPAPHLKLVK